MTSPGLQSGTTRNFPWRRIWRHPVLAVLSLFAKKLKPRLISGWLEKNVERTVYHPLAVQTYGCLIVWRVHRIERVSAFLWLWFSFLRFISFPARFSSSSISIWSSPPSPIVILKFYFSTFKSLYKFILKWLSSEYVSLSKLSTYRFESVVNGN